MLTGGGEKDAVLEDVLGNGVPVLVHVVEEGRAHKSLFNKERVARANFLLHARVTLTVAQSNVSGQDGAVGALALLLVEEGFLYELDRMLKAPMFIVFLSIIFVLETINKSKFATVVAVQ